MAQANNSSEFGYLTETSTVTVDNIRRLWHDVLAGLTGFDTNLVRLAEQRDPPPTPANNVDWIAYKVISGNTPVNFPQVIHRGDNDGGDIVIDQIPEDIIIYCYGPNASDTVDTIRRGIHVSQNRDQLFLNGIGIQTVGSSIQVPTLQNNKWLERFDIIISTIRESIGTYKVLNLLSARGLLQTDIKHEAEEPISEPFDTDNIKIAK